MKTYLRAMLVAFALVLSSCSDSAQPTASQQQPSGIEKKSTSSWQDWSATIYNECCDDTITLNARYHLVMKNDGSRAKVNLAQLVGTGVNGDTYHGTAGAQQTSNPDGTGSYKEHWTLTRADGCTFHLTVSYDVVLDEFGNPALANYTYEIECS